MQVGGGPSEQQLGQGTKAEASIGTENSHLRPRPGPSLTTVPQALHLVHSTVYLGFGQQRKLVTTNSAGNLASGSPPREGSAPRNAQHPRSEGPAILGSIRGQWLSPCPTGRDSWCSRNSRRGLEIIGWGQGGQRPRPGP